MGFDIEVKEKIIENVANIAYQQSIIRLKRKAISKYCIVEEINKIVVIAIKKIENKDQRQIKVD